MTTVFESSATNKGGRNGHVTSESGLIDLDCKMPKSNKDKSDTHTNPEELFAAAYSTCFGGALEHVAKEQDLGDLGDFSVTATIGFVIDEDGVIIEATLDCYLPTLDKEAGENLINDAHEICPYSRATRDNIDVTLNLLVDA
ncbi:Ohr family peroxiredoxin [Sungkyunkwania multivorans]|uniref:Ohr family peroxiredoxin n=1 Tax=Sungkyunkwania multivorans TaxID=1173618 RepID=A0ABW3CZ87_9FLAO